MDIQNVLILLWSRTEKQRIYHELSFHENIVARNTEQKIQLPCIATLNKDKLDWFRVPTVLQVGAQFERKHRKYGQIKTKKLKGSLLLSIKTECR